AARCTGRVGSRRSRRPWCTASFRGATLIPGCGRPGGASHAGFGLHEVRPPAPEKRPGAPQARIRGIRPAKPRQMSSHYEVLGITRKAKAKDVQKAFERKMAKLEKNP